MWTFGMTFCSVAFCSEPHLVVGEDSVSKTLCVSVTWLGTYVSGSLLICPLLSSLCLGVSVSQRPFVAALCERHGHPGWRVLGSFLSVRRPQRQDPGSHWLRGLPQTGGTAAVSIYQKEGWASSRQWGSRKEWGHRGVEMSKGSRAGRREMDERRRKQYEYKKCKEAGYQDKQVILC